MKDRLEKTKVVLRHLPPAMSEAALMEQIDGRFSGRYNWVRFRPGKISQKHQRYSRAYLELRRAEDVLEFAEFFDGHIFVNEKGAQFKAVVEYAPSQCVPNQCCKKDGREGTILKDPEYLEFLELLAKPVENLPSAEIQLERKEAERAGATKETLIVTPLMDFVRQRRAAKNGSQRAIVNGKLSRRSAVVSTTSSSPSSKRGSEKRRGPTLMYVSKDTTKVGRVKDKSTYILVSRKEEQKLPDKHVAVTSATGTDSREDEAVTGVNETTSRAPGAVEIEKRKVVLLKGKEKDNSQVSGNSVRNTATLLRQNQRQDTGGRIIRSILSQKEGQQVGTLNTEKDKRPPRPPIARSILKDHSPSSFLLASAPDSDSARYVDDKAALNDHCSTPISEKQDRRTRNRDRPDRGVWAPLRRSDGSHSSEESRSSSSLSAQMSSDSLDGFQTTETKAKTDTTPVGYGGVKNDIPSSSRITEIKNLGSGRSSTPSENGSHKHIGRRGTGPVLKDVDSSLSFAEGKSFKKGSTGYSSHERQVWVQKSGSASF